jgi:hypothetical protein
MTCPYCQNAQPWYKSPQSFSVLFSAALIPIMVLGIPRLTRGARFEDYKDKFAVAVVRDDQAGANGGSRLITVRLENHTGKTWKRPTFEVDSLDKGGEVLAVEHLIEYGAVVGANSSVLVTLTLRIIPTGPVSNRRVMLTDGDARY